MKLQALLVFALLVVAGCKAPSGSNVTYTVLFLPPLGKPLHYKMSVSQTSFNVDASFTVTTSSLKGNKFSVRTTIDSMQLPGTPFGQVGGAFGGAEIVQTVGADGHILSAEGSGRIAKIFESAGMGTVASAFYNRPTRIGEPIPYDVGPADQKIRCTAKLLAVKVIDGVQVATIQTISEPQGKLESSQSIGTIEVDTGVLRSLRTISTIRTGDRINEVTVTVTLQ